MTLESLSPLLKAANVVHTDLALRWPERYVKVIVCPQERVRNVEQELALRRQVDGLIVGYIAQYEGLAMRVNYMGDNPWAVLNEARDVECVGFVGWHFRGMAEIVSVAYMECILSRIEKGLPTIVQCSADPHLIEPRWHSDLPLLDMLKHPDMIVRPGPRKERLK